MSTAGGTGAGDAVLAVPPSLWLPPAARDRLARQFARRPAGVVAIAAPVVPLTPGSSATTTAEWWATAPLDAVEVVAGPEITGAVLVEAGVTHSVGERSVTVPVAPGGDAHLLVDLGAASFEPIATPGSPAPTNAERARPPFRWRPVVVFLAGRSDPAQATAAAALANGLIRHDVEARLALLDPVEAPLWCAPCLADAASVAPLVPDVVVALDEAAADRADRWALGHRGTVVVVLDADLGSNLELVPWTIGRAQGRRRARIGPTADPVALAALVNRLCAGPLPEPPADLGTDDEVEAAALDTVDADGSDDDGTAVAVPVRARRPAPRRIGVVRDEHPSPLLAGLADHLAAAGHDLRDVRDLDGTDGSGPDAVDLLLVDPGAGHRVAAVPAIPLVVVLTDAAAVEPDPAALVVTDRATTADAARAAGAPALALPVLRTRDRLVELRRARLGRVRPSAATIAVLGGAGTAAIADGLGSVRQADPDLVVTEVRADDALTDAVEVAGWSLVVWDPAGAEGGAEHAVTAALAGVPVVTTEAGAVALEGVVGADLAVADPDDPAAWSAAIADLLDDDRRRTASTVVAARAEAVHGEAAAGLAVDRFLGWVARSSRPAAIGANR